MKIEVLELTEIDKKERNSATIKFSLDDGSQCVCGKCDTDYHTCPFDDEMGGDGGVCNCCEYCTNECAMSV